MVRQRLRSLELVLRQLVGCGAREEKWEQANPDQRAPHGATWAAGCCKSSVWGLNHTHIYIFYDLPIFDSLFLLFLHGDAFDDGVDTGAFLTFGSSAAGPGRTRRAFGAQGAHSGASSLTLGGEYVARAAIAAKLVHAYAR